jgi:peptidyl-prolyl cis-trans isomerase SurA
MIKNNKFIAFLLVLMTIVSFSKKVTASNTLSIAAVVNDDIISVYDVEARMQIVMATSGIKNSLEARKKLVPQVIRELVNERLKLQEAEKEGIEVSQSDLEGAYRNVEVSNKMPKGQLKVVLSRLNIDMDSYNEQIKAQIAWVKLVQRKLRRSVSVGDDEVEEKIAKIKESVGKPSMKVSEIFIPVENSQEEAGKLSLANKIREHVSKGASFAMLARQFSQSATAATGGSLGWIYKGQLEKELDEALVDMELGKVSKPVRTMSGYYLLYLQDKKVMKAFDETKTSYKLAQVFIPYSMEKGKKTVIEKDVSLANGSCKRFTDIAKKRALENSGVIGAIPLDKMPMIIKNAVENLKEKQISKKLSMKEGEAYLMICGKEVPSTIPSKKEIRKNIENQRLELLARNMLHDLKRTSIIEFRR